MEEAAEELDELFAAAALVHGDARIDRVAAGHAVQAVFQHRFGERGCDVPSCPMHVAATHDELTRAHLSEDSGLCERHARMLVAARGEPPEAV